MGRKRELETVHLVVSVLCSNRKKGITRKALIEKIVNEHGIGERSIAEALSILKKSGILRKTSEPFGARLRIDLYNAQKGYRDFFLEDLQKTTNHLPDRMKNDVYNSYVEINNAVVDGEIGLIKKLAYGPEYWSDYPVEARLWATNFEIQWTMRYLEVWKSRQKIMD